MAMLVAVLLGSPACVDLGSFTTIRAGYDDQCRRVAIVWREQAGGAMKPETVRCEFILNDPEADAELLKACRFEGLSTCEPTDVDGGGDAGVDVHDVLDVTDTPDTSDAADIPDASDVADTSDVADATDATDATDVDDTGDAAEVSETSDIGEDQEDAEAEVSNALPVLAVPQGDSVAIEGDGPAYTGIVQAGAMFAINFLAADSDAGDILTTSVAVVGGTLDGTAAGFQTAFPFTPAGGPFPHTVTIGGVAQGPGTILLEATVVDSKGAEATISLLLRVNAAPTVSVEPIEGGSVHPNGSGFVARIPLYKPLDLRFRSEDADAADLLTTSVTVTGGALLPAEAGMNETFPLVGTESVGPQLTDTTGTPQVPGTVEFTVTVTDNTGGTTTMTVLAIFQGPGMDFNGDGYADALVGGRGVDTAGVDAGAAFLFYGGPDVLAQTLVANADVTFLGEAAGDRFGEALSNAGDVNNDGYDDILVGAPYAKVGADIVGKAYLFFGGPEPEATLYGTTAGARFIGGTPDVRFGSAIRGADLDNDGWSDIIVGEAADPLIDQDRSVHIFRGGTSIPTITSAANADGVLSGDDVSWGRFGATLEAGDVNGDGYTDLLVGGPGGGIGPANPGQVYIFLGDGTIKSATSSEAEHIVAKFGPGAQSGLALGVGDFNGDGLADYVVNQTSGSQLPPILIYASVFLGSAGELPSSPQLVITAESGSELAKEMAIVGDLNADGFDDVAVSGVASDSTSRIWVFFGSTTPPSALTTSSADFVITSTTAHIHQLRGVGGFTDIEGGTLLSGGSESNEANLQVWNPNLPTNWPWTSGMGLYSNVAGDEIGCALGGL